MNKVCEAIKNMESPITGDVVPVNWYSNIRKNNKTKTVDIIAIALLANIYYWYRPTPIDDEVSGKVVGYKQKFKADKLQKNYQEYADLLGVSKRTIKNSMDTLVRLELITREFRKIITKNGLVLTNVMFLEPIIHNIISISSPDKVGGDTRIVGEVVHKIGETYTKTTTETTSNNKDPLSNESVPPYKESFPTTEEEIQTKERTQSKERNVRKKCDSPDDHKLLEEYIKLTSEEKELYDEYIEFRRRKKYPTNLKIHKRLFKRYKELGGDKQIIESAIVGGYRNLFPINNYKPKKRYSCL
ncbi:MAG: hypothetical protein U9O59_07290 [Actinomycetota bacterium]|nr:hypothetical protein [Actinomycetota bacterium]